MKSRIALALATVALACVPAARAHAHGIWGHIHVTGWAIENLSPGELRDFFAEPEVMNAALFGAAFTDSGYWPQAGDLAERSRAYSEHTHWEPFIQEFVEWVVENDPPPWDDLESRRRVGFLLGCAAHGLQDEIFDSLFLHQIDEHDGAGQSEADPATDAFMSLDELMRFAPDPYYPTETLLELYEGLGPDIDADTIETSVRLMTTIYVNERASHQLDSLGNRYSSEIEWTYAHYMDPAVPGSLGAEIIPTGAYMQAIWERLHGTFDREQVVVATYPEVPQRLRSHVHDTADNLVTYVFGMGVAFSAMEGAFLDDAVLPVDFGLQNTRWGAQFPRLVSFRANEDLTPGAWYTTHLRAGAELIDGDTIGSDQSLRFQVACDGEDLETCPALDITPPDIAGPDVGQPDAGNDAGTADVGADAGDTNAPTDTGNDTSLPDVPDVGVDAETQEVSDAGPVNDDASNAEASGQVRGGSQCSQAPFAAGLFWLAAASFRRRRAR